VNVKRFAGYLVNRGQTRISIFPDSLHNCDLRCVFAVMLVLMT
jgi:hypothetical protein